MTGYPAALVLDYLNRGLGHGRPATATGWDHCSVDIHEKPPVGLDVHGNVPLDSVGDPSTMRRSSPAVKESPIFIRTLGMNYFVGPCSQGVSRHLRWPSETQCLG